MRPPVEEGSEDSSVCVLMLNPSLDEKRSTSYAVLEVVSERKGWNMIEIANLFPVHTRNSKLLAATSLNRSDIFSARPRIDAAIARCAEVLFAWGVAPLPGIAGRLYREQVEWVISRTAHYGHEDAWMMGGEPRHPSRWRQYVGPQRAIVSGVSTAERLERALVRRPIHDAMKGMSVTQTRLRCEDAWEEVPQT
ncbi:DUF1643 domain-containing protein [Microbacterium aurugineum]|uniref:DUF1643 domain-containing protein n=1 Tax=Microbacterium aurugineum TaxID=2851642 RepID=UPI0024A6BB55|nr:DUF1643 domain-containing protein [Microbacterium aurugineum]